MYIYVVSHVAQWWRTHLLMHKSQEMQVRSLGQEDPLEEGMPTHSRILAWKIHGRRGLVGRRVPDTTEWLSMHSHLYWDLFEMVECQLESPFWFAISGSWGGRAVCTGVPGLMSAGSEHESPVPRGPSQARSPTGAWVQFPLPLTAVSLGLTASPLYAHFL